MIRLALLCALSLLLVTGAAQAECTAIRSDQNASSKWNNPHPAPTDVELKFRGTSIIFHPVDMATDNMFDAGEQSIYEMGSSDNNMFETRLKVRIASSIIAGQPKRMRLLIGKYEITKAQYALIIGGGSLKEGLRILFEHTADAKFRAELESFFEGECEGVMTRKIARVLAEPISHLTYDRITGFIRKANEICIETPSCQRVLRGISQNDLIPGFLRLPIEHEWEFVARGGGAFVKGAITREELQLDRPAETAGSAIEQYAHISNSPPRLLPIGSKKPLFGIYDMFGNAEELMGNFFTSENGFGAVGAFVARGGNYRLGPTEVRVSRRVEVNQFVLDTDRDEFRIQYFPTVGFRLVVGLPVQGGVDRVGSDELEVLFTQNYSTVDEGASNAIGRSIEDPSRIPPLTDDPAKLAFDMTPTFAGGHVSTVVSDYGELFVRTSASHPINLSVSDLQGNVLAEKEVQTGSFTNNLGAFLPGRYTISMIAARSLSAPSAVNAELSFRAAADTGVPFPNLANLAKATSLNTTSSALALQGFVGRDDNIDSYPVQVGSAFDSIKISLDVPRRRDLIVKLLDSKLNTRTEVTLQRTEADLILPVREAFRGFVQFQALPNANGYTDYEGRIKGFRSTSPELSTSSSPSRTMRAGTVYSGLLSRDRTTLNSLFQLSGSKSVRIDLSDMSADVNMTIYRMTGGSPKKIPFSNVAGTRSEVFVGDLESGRYRVQIKRAKRNDPGFDSFSIKYTILGDAKPKIQTVAQLRETAKRQAERIYVSSFSQNKTLKNAITYFKLPASTGKIYDFNVSATGQDIDLFIENASGRVLEKSVESGSREEQIRLEAQSGDISDGHLYLRIEAQDQVRGQIYLSLKASEVKPIAKASHFTDSIPLVTTYKDWEVRYDAERCVARTLAFNAEPTVGWRKKLPWFIIIVRPGANSLGTSMDNLGDENLTYANNRATIDVLIGSSWRSRNVYVHNDDNLKPLQSDLKFIDNRTVTMFSQGKRMVVRGSTTDADPTYFSYTYSLQGYTAAIKRINAMCNARILWMLGR